VLIKPPRLRRGDVVGVFSPSSEIHSFPRRTGRALEALSAAGYVPRLASNARAKLGKLAGSAQQRAQDLHELVRMNDVRAILCTTGGHSTNSLLPLIDFELLRAHPKILCGYSDATALLGAAYARANLCTFHGPALLPSFGEFGGPFRFTLNWFTGVAGHAETPPTLARPTQWTDAYRHWDRDDSELRPLRPTTPWVCLAPGSVEGVLVGGNLSTLVRLLGTPYMPDLRGAVLFLEETESTPAQIEALLQQLSQSGVLEHVRGLVFGLTHGFTDDPEYSLYDVLRGAIQRRPFPILADVDFGHTDPRLTLPLGVACRLDADAGALTLLEPAVHDEIAEFLPQ
jgi:muramoyltetrapeptide carboxypeptidase